jgi:hypothetical protein
MADILVDSRQVESIMAAAVVSVFKQKLEGYNSPLDSIVTDAFKINESAIRKAVYKATQDCIGSDAFGEQLTAALNHKLANLIINKCAGLVESSFQTIMQDQVLRTKLQAAVIAIIESK